MDGLGDRAKSVQRLLITAPFDLPSPNRRASRLTAFAYKDVSGFQPELVLLRVCKVHLVDI